MRAILKKELKANYTSLFTYVYYAIYFLALGILFCVQCLPNYNTQFGYYVLAKASYICALVIPFFTMRMFAGEKRSRTDQLLYTSPVASMGILFGKYLAAVITILVPVVLSVIYPIVIAGCGDMSVRFVVCAYIAVCLEILALTAIGMFFSTLTSNIFLAALFQYALYVVLLLLRILERIAGQDALYEFLHHISVYNIYNDMISGIVKSGDIIFLLLITVLFVFLAGIGIGKRGRTIMKRGAYAVCGIALFLLLSTVGFSSSRVYDFTPEGLLTLSEETREILSNVDEETTIYYMGAISNANATYREFLDLYKRSNDNIKVRYMDVNENPSFREEYLSDIDVIHQASILVAGSQSYIYLDSDDYISTTQVSAYSYQSLLEIEGQLTGAIYYTNLAEKSKLYYAEGHGEADFTGKFVRLLAQSGYSLDNYVNIGENVRNFTDNIPEDCDILIINAPQTDYTTEETKALSDYIHGGGRVMVFLDPLNEDTSNLFAFLKEFGFEVVSGVVVETDESRYVYDTNNYIVPKMADHEITEALKKNHLNVLTMTSKGIPKEYDSEGSDRTDLLLTSGTAYSKVSDFENLTVKGEDDIGGPFSVASIYEEDAGKLFLMTSNLFLNEEVDEETLGANRRFVLYLANYMSGNQDAVSVIGKDVNFKTAFYSNSLITFIRILTMLIVPVLILIIGVVILVLRNKNIIVSMLEKREIEKTLGEGAENAVMAEQEVDRKEGDKRGNEKSGKKI